VGGLKEKKQKDYEAVRKAILGMKRACPASGKKGRNEHRVPKRREDTETKKNSSRGMRLQRKKGKRLFTSPWHGRKINTRDFAGKRRNQKQ